VNRADTFSQWLWRQHGRDDPVGSLSRYWVADVRAGCARQVVEDPETVRRHLTFMHYAGDTLLAALDAAAQEWPDDDGAP